MKKLLDHVEAKSYKIFEKFRGNNIAIVPCTDE